MDFSTLYQIPVTFQKGEGTAKIIAYIQDKKWYLYNFSVNSEALRDYKKEERIKNLPVAKEIVKKLCTEWDADFAREKFSTILKNKKQFQKEVLEKDFGNNRKILGQFVKVVSSISNGVANLDGFEAFPYIFEVEFEKATIIVTVKMIQENNVWKIHHLDFKQKQDQ